jgi:hypothetical protein
LQLDAQRAECQVLSLGAQFFLAECQGLSLLALLVQKNKQKVALRAARGVPGAQFTCFASTKVQILTPEGLRVRRGTAKQTRWSVNSKGLALRL